MADGFAALQAKLAAALEANRPGSTTPHVLIALPSYSVSESLLSHYGNRIPSLEHRYLNAIVIPARIETCEMLYISTRPPQPEVIDYYVSLVLPERRRACAIGFGSSRFPTTGRRDRSPGGSSTDPT